MQLFNELNARKIKDEWNCLEGLGASPMFIGIWIIELSLQLIMVAFGGFAMNCHLDFGLTWDQWILSLVIGIIVMPWRFLLICLPL